MRSEKKRGRLKNLLTSSLPVWLRRTPRCLLSHFTQKFQFKWAPTAEHLEMWKCKLTARLPPFYPNINRGKVPWCVARFFAAWREKLELRREATPLKGGATAALQEIIFEHSWHTCPAFRSTQPLHSYKSQYNYPVKWSNIRSKMVPKSENQPLFYYDINKIGFLRISWLKSCSLGKYFKRLVNNFF